MTPIEHYELRLRERFAASADGGEQLKIVLAMAGELPPFDPTLRTEEARLHGCQSRIWLVLGIDACSARLRVAADSDALLMRGLLTIAVGLYGDRTPREIVAYPPERLLGSGILEALAPSRANGFARILGRIHGFAVQRCLKEDLP